MTTPTRVYITNQAGVVRLVRAANVSQARNFVARDSIAVEVASQDDLIAYLTAVPPTPVEDATSKSADTQQTDGASE